MENDSTAYIAGSAVCQDLNMSESPHGSRSDQDQDELNDFLNQGDCNFDAYLKEIGSLDFCRFVEGLRY